MKYLGVDLYSLQIGDRFIEDCDFSEIFVVEGFKEGPNGPSDNQVVIGQSSERTVDFFYSGNYSHYGPKVQKVNI